MAASMPLRCLASPFGLLAACLKMSGRKKGACSMRHAHAKSFCEANSDRGLADLGWAILTWDCQHVKMVRFAAKLPLGPT